MEREKKRERDELDAIKEYLVFAKTKMINMALQGQNQKPIDGLLCKTDAVQTSSGLCTPLKIPFF